MAIFRPQEIRSLSDRIADLSDRLEKNGLVGDIVSEFSEIILTLSSIFPEDSILNRIKSTLLATTLSQLKVNIASVSRSMPYFENGSGINKVDLVSISTKSRVEKCLEKSVRIAGNDDRLIKMQRCLRNPEDVIRITDDSFSGVSISDTNDVQSLIEKETHEQPTVVYSGQCLETENDVISGGFYGCCLAEVFLPNKRCHVSFHLPAEWNDMNNTGSYSLWTPGFFYRYLSESMKRHECNFEDLNIKIVVGIQIPPDEIKASFLALGCKTENVNLYQLPIYNFSTMTSADKQNILIIGKKAEYLEQSEAPPGGKIVNATGGKEEFCILDEEANFLV